MSNTTVVILWYLEAFLTRWHALFSSGFHCSRGLNRLARAADDRQGLDATQPATGSGWPA